MDEDCLTCTEVALFDDRELLRLPALVVRREFLLQNGMEFVDVDLVGSVKVSRFQDDHQNGQSEQQRKSFNVT